MKAIVCTRGNPKLRTRRWTKQRYTNQAGIEITIESDGVETNCLLATSGKPADCPLCKDAIVPLTVHRCRNYGDGTWSKSNEPIQIFER